MVRRAPRFRPNFRPTEATLLGITTAIAVLGFAMTEIAKQLQNDAAPLAAIGIVVALTLSYAVPVWGIHFALCLRRLRGNQLIWPLLAMILAFGLIMVNLVGGTLLANQQIQRGLWPGCVIIAFLLLFPQIIERLMRNRYTVLIMMAGSLFLLVITILFGQADEATGATINLSVANTLAIQTTELVKVALIFFLAWYIDYVGEDAGSSEHVFGFLTYPRPIYLLPGLLVFGIAALLLFWMADLGALLVLTPLLLVLLYTGLQTRAFLSIAVSGIAVSAILGVILMQFVSLPVRVVDRWMAFRNPWSTEISPFWGEPIYVSSGIQLQQAIYGAIEGGLWGQGAGFGHSEFIPLGLSDFILAATAEEFGLVVIAILFTLYLLLFWRMLRVALLLPAYQLFERIVIIGIVTHLCCQMFFMATGTFNLTIMTGITVPFMSKGGVALLVNSAEIGIVLALALRLEEKHG